MHKIAPIAITFLMGAINVASADAPTQPSSAPSTAPGASTFLTGPPQGDGPVVVRASFRLRDINEIDDEAEAFEFDGVLTLTWQDPRQAFDPAELGVDEKVYLGAYQFNEIFAGWFPQVVLVNESGPYEKHGTALRAQPDGTITLIETLNASGKADLDLRRYPFDKQRLTATFEVLGFDANEVVFEAGSGARGASSERVRLPQWTLRSITASTRERDAPYTGSKGIASAYVVSMEVDRDPFFMIRLVILPLILIVMLSWSVFWMDQSSMADRINVSFIGILTAVAYQIVVGDIMPHISYMTLMHGFLNLSFFVMCATVVVNLLVGKLDEAGRPEAGNAVDHRCRRLFPLTYVVLNLLMVGVAFVFF